MELIIKMKMNIKGSLILLLTATIWGVAFVAQSAGMDYVGGFTFNCIRSIIGGMVLIPCIFIIRKIRSKDNGNAESREAVLAGKKTLITGGISCGVLLCIASNFQQFGIKYTSVGKAGFITALYIVIVPALGLVLKKKVGKLVWLGVALAVAGLYFLCIDESFSIEMGDLLVLCCAFVFTLHILAIDYFSPRVDGVAMSCIQFFACGILSAIPMFIFESINIEDIMNCALPILYAGVMSSGVAYTLQIIGQKNMNPTVASMILSMESVISVLAGWIVLGEMLAGKEIFGCFLMFVAIVISQIPENKNSK